MSRWPAAAAFAAALLAAAALGDSAWPVLRSGVVPLVLLLLTTLLATGSGRVLVGRFGLSDLSESQKTLIGATLGLGLLSLGTLALGALGLFKPWAASALLAVLWVAGYAELRPALSSLSPDRSLLESRPLAAAAIALPLALSLWACLMPPHQYDSLVYHMALPQDYLLSGRLHAPEGLLFAHFPQNGEMLFTLALLAGSDVLAQMYVWLAFVLSIAWLFSLGRREAPMSAVLLACFLTATHAALLLTASTTYVEPLVMLWVTAGALCFERWRQLPGARGWLALSAVFIGLALGTKYYAGLGAVALGLRLLWRVAKTGDRRAALEDLALFTGLVTVVFAPWLVKNWLLVKNPVFPFLYKHFANTGTGWNGDAAAGYFRVLTEYGHAEGWLMSLLKLPVLLLRNPLRFGGGMDVLGDVGWTLLLGAIPLGVWSARENGFRRGLLAFCGLWAVGWFSSGVVLRFLTVLIPLLALTGSAGLVRLHERLGAPGRAVLVAAVGAMTAVNLFLVLYVHAVFGTPSVLLGLESREEFLGRRLDYYPCAAVARDLPSPSGRILVVGEQRGYYIGREHLPSSVHAPNLWVRMAEEASSPADLSGRLAAAGFSHVLFVPKESARLGAALGTFTAKGQANWDGLESQLSVVAKARGCLIAAVEPKP
jgi:hypothetical protein